MEKKIRASEEKDKLGLLPEIRYRGIEIEGKKGEAIR